MFRNGFLLCGLTVMEALHSACEPQSTVGRGLGIPLWYVHTTYGICVPPLGMHGWLKAEEKARTLSTPILSTR